MSDSWLKNRKKAMDWLIKNFPDSIGANKPLKVGIFNDIKEFDSDDKPALVWIRRAMRLHTSRKRYLKQLHSDVDRVNLYGSPNGKVTIDEVENAKQKILASMKKFKKQAKELEPPANKEKVLAEVKIETKSGRPILKLKKKLISFCEVNHNE
tara:strand:+ start:2672 stop:3130 length:459 start_codon:yes stop_codon:yes gene_type:complete